MREETVFILSNRQRSLPFDLTFIKAVVQCALPRCLELVRSSEVPLGRLERIEAVILGNRSIAKVHGDFLGDLTPTDVITFPYGEILIGAGVVSENAGRFGHSASEEAALCIIHGILHLAGWEDQTADEAKDMARKQEQVFKVARKMVCSRIS
ncbi:MAG TPA: rRNA maturation RNase YbeY [Terrimicrobiaceae bacterium]